MKWIAWLMKAAVKTAFICVICTFVTFTLVQVYVTQLLQPMLPQVASVGMNDWLSHITAPFQKEREVLSPTPSEQEGSRQSNPERNRETHSQPEDKETSGKSNTAIEDRWTSDDRHDHEMDSNGREENSGQHPNEFEDSDDRKTGTEDGIMEDAVAVWGSQDLSITSEDIIRLKDELSDTEKMQIFSIVAANIPMEEIQTLSTMLEDGLSPNEIAQIDELIQNYLNDEDYEQVRKLIFKTDTN